MASQSLGSLAVKLFGIGCGFLFAVAAARLLGPRGYGLVAVALSASTLAATIALLGTDGLAVREVGASLARGDWNRIRRFLKWSISTVSLTAITAALIIAGVAFLAGPYRSTLLLASVGVPL